MIMPIVTIWRLFSTWVRGIKHLGLNALIESSRFLTDDIDDSVNNTWAIWFAFFCEQNSFKVMSTLSMTPGKIYISSMKQSQQRAAQNNPLRLVNRNDVITALQESSSRLLLSPTGRVLAPCQPTSCPPTARCAPVLFETDELICISTGRKLVVLHNE